MTNTTTLLDEELKRTGGNISKVARALGLDYYALRDRREREIASLQHGMKTATGPEPDDIRVLGRVGFQHNVIAVKRQGEAWPAKYAAIIKDARKKFDAGTHEMFQTVDNGWVAQYLIPRLRPTERRKYFSTLDYAV